jgi:transcriptional regulator with XRE-family HTH domain
MDLDSVPWSVMAKAASQRVSEVQRRPSSSATALVQEARRASGLSQRELARRSGVSRTTVVEIESGKRDPALGTLRAILRALGRDVELRLISYDDHDATLSAAMASLTPKRRAELHANLDRFVEGLAAGLPSSRPLLGSDERSAS